MNVFVFCKSLRFPILFCVLYHCASFTTKCHGTAALQTQSVIHRYNLPLVSIPTA